MEDTYAIFYDCKLLVILTGFDGAPLPDRFDILDWYAKNYAFERKRLSGGYAHSISVKGMKYEEFQCKQDERCPNCNGRITEGKARLCYYRAFHAEYSAGNNHGQN